MSHPLIFTERRLLPRLVDTLLTLLAWAGFGWLIYQGLINVLQAQPHAGPRPLELNINTISLYVVIVLANALLLILWAQYNRYRFSEERRLRRDELSDEALARLLQLPVKHVREMQNARSMVVRHDGNGNILEYVHHLDHTPPDDLREAARKRAAKG